MPMLYVVQKGGNFVERATNPDEIIYIKCAVKDILEAKTVCYFSDGHATDRLTTLYDRSSFSSWSI